MQIITKLGAYFLTIVAPLRKYVKKNLNVDRGQLIPNLLIDILSEIQTPTDLYKYFSSFNRIKMIYIWHFYKADLFIWQLLCGVHETAKYMPH